MCIYVYICVYMCVCEEKTVHTLNVYNIHSKIFAMGGRNMNAWRRDCWRGTCLMHALIKQASTATSTIANIKGSYTIASPSPTSSPANLREGDVEKELHRKWGGGGG